MISKRFNFYLIFWYNHSVKNFYFYLWKSIKVCPTLLKEGSIPLTYVIKTWGKRKMQLWVSSIYEEHTVKHIRIFVMRIIHNGKLMSSYIISLIDLIWYDKKKDVFFQLHYLQPSCFVFLLMMMAKVFSLKS